MSNYWALGFLILAALVIFDSNFFNEEEDVKIIEKAIIKNCTAHNLQLVNHDKKINIGTKRLMLISEHSDPTSEIGCEGAGGQNIYVKYLGEILSRLGWTVDIFTHKSSSNQSDIVHLTQKCRVIRLESGPLKFIPRDEFYQFYPHFISSLHKFIYETQTHYHIIHSNYWVSGVIGLNISNYYKIPIVHTYHSHGKVKYQNIRSSLIPKISKTRVEEEQNILDYANKIIANSDTEKKFLATDMGGKSEKIITIPGGVNIQNFKPIPMKSARLKLDIPQNLRIILYVGRFDERKGLSTLISAFASLRKNNETLNTRLYLVGGADHGVDYREKMRVEKEAKSLNVLEDIVFSGMIQHEFLNYYYNSADVVVVPSYYEPFGLTAIEAMSSGRAVIGSKVGGLKNTIIHNETGLHFEARNAQDLYKSLIQVLSNDSFRKYLGKNGRKRVEEMYNWTNIVKSISKLYDSLIQ